MLEMRLFLLLVFFTSFSVGEMWLEGEGAFPTMPLPLTGWLDKSMHYNLSIVPVNESKSEQANGAIAMYTYDIIEDTYEELIRDIQSMYRPAVILLISYSNDGSGDLYRVTDGKRNTGDLTTPTAMITLNTFTKLMTLVTEPIPANISFNETNWNVYYDESPVWNIILSFPTVLSMFGAILGAFHFSLYVYYRVPFDNPHIALLFETVGNVLRFLYSIDLVGTRLLYPYQFTRSLMTIHIPLSMGTAFLITLHMGALIRSKTTDTRTFLERKWLKIAFIVGFTSMAVFEVVSQIGTLATPAFAIFTLFTACVYGVVAILVSGLFAFGTFFIARSMRVRILKVELISFETEENKEQQSTIEEKEKESSRKLLARSRRWFANFLRRYLLSSFGYVMFAISILLLFVKLAPMSSRSWVLLSRVGPFLSCLGLTLSSLAHVVSYTPTTLQRSLRSLRSSKSSGTARTTRSSKTGRVANESNYTSRTKSLSDDDE